MVPHVHCTNGVIFIVDNFFSIILFDNIQDILF